jgi:hypothetical protein
LRLLQVPTVPYRSIRSLLSHPISSVSGIHFTCGIECKV